MIFNLILSAIFLTGLLLLWFKSGLNLNLKLKTKKNKNQELAASYLSKAGNRNSSKSDVIYSNVNLLDKNGNKLWSGNINVTTKFEHIYDLSKLIGKLYICPVNETDYKNKSMMKI